MSLACVPTCARPGCGQAASTSARPVGSDAAYMPVCSQRCGYELIGPKRSAADAAADDSDVDDGSGGGAARQLVLANLQKEGKRLDDLAKMANTLASLSRLRARMRDETNLEISAATMTIGRRLDVDGSTIAQRLEIAIEDAIVIIRQIADRRAYDMTIIARQMERLRDDIAADGSLDMYDATDDGQAAKAAGVDDDARLVAAYRANRIQKVAEFDVTDHYHKNRPFFELGNSGLIYISNVFHRPNGVTMSADDASKRGYFQVNALLPKYIGTYTRGAQIDPASEWTFDEAQRKVHNKRTDQSDLIPEGSKFVSFRQHAAVFSAEKQTSGGFKTSYFKFVDGANKPVLKASWMIDKVYLHTPITLDADGNVWAIGASNTLRVFNADGVPISSMYGVKIRALASAAIGGVWALVKVQSPRFARFYCANFRLVPAAELNRDPMDTAAAKPDRVPRIPPDLLRFEGTMKTVINEIRFKLMADAAVMLRELVDLRARVASMTPLEVASATLLIGRRLARDGSSIAGRIDGAIDAVIEAIENRDNELMVIIQPIEQMLSKLRDDIAADGVLDAFDASPAGLSDAMRQLNDDARSLVAYRANPVEKVAEIDVDAVFSIVHPINSGEIIARSGRDIWRTIIVGPNKNRLGRKTWHDFVREDIDNALITGLSTQWTRKSTNGPMVQMVAVDDPSSTVYEFARDRARCFVTGRHMVMVFLDFDAADFDRSNTLEQRTASRVFCRFFQVDDQGIVTAGNYVPISSAMTMRFSLATMALDSSGHLWCISGGLRYILVYSSTSQEIAPGREIARVSEKDVHFNCIGAGVSGVWAMANTVDERSRMFIANYRLAPETAYSAGMQEPSGANAKQV